jgi:hypothetical protein
MLEPKGVKPRRVVWAGFIFRAAPFCRTRKQREKGKGTQVPKRKRYTTNVPSLSCCVGGFEKKGNEEEETDRVLPKQGLPWQGRRRTKPEQTSTQANSEAKGGE